MAANPVIRHRELKLESKSRLQETTVRATGPITCSTSARLEQTIADRVARFDRVMIDVSKVDYIDSSGLGVLLTAYAQARKTNCDLEIINPRPRGANLLRLWLRSVFEGREEFLGLTPD